jgi:mRNA interferase MazF
MAFKRGDVVSVAAGSGFGSKPRPALVVQSEAFPHLTTVILALFTTELKAADLFRPRVEPDSINGLRAPSDLMTDILISVPRDRIGGVIGHLSAADMTRAQTALLTILGFAR